VPESTVPTPKTPAVEPRPFYQKTLVQCEGFRGLAYRNLAGQWTTVTGDKVLPGNIEVLEQ
jgi:hypothetical protein